VKASDFFSLPDSLALFRPFFNADSPPWEWVGRIGPALAAQRLESRPAQLPPGVHIEGPVHIDATVALPHHATIIGPVWIGPGTQVRSCAAT
jgi:hypothetical protein